MSKPSKSKIIRTSDDNWLEEALNCYSNKISFEFIDDADIGFTKKDLKSAVNLIAATNKKASIPWKEIAAVLVSIGISGTGIYIILIAVADPEPTSKLSLLLAGGVVLTLTGGLGALKALGIEFKVKGSATKGSFEINPS